MVDLGALKLAINVDSKQAEKDLDNFSDKAKNGGGGLKALGTVAKGVGVSVAAVGTAAAASVTAIVNGAKDTANAADTIDKASQRMGVSASYYQKLDYAAGMCGISMGTMERAAKTLETSANGMSFEEAINEVMSVTDETERAAKATELFGSKAAYELQPMLNAGAEGFSALCEEAEQYGVIMSDEAVAAGAAFNDSLSKMNQTIDGVKNKLMAEFLPSLTEITNGFAGVIAGVDGAEEALAQGIEDFVSKIGEVLPKVLEIATQIIVALAKAIVENLPTLIETIIGCVNDIITALVNALPQILSAVIQMVLAIIQGLANMLPQIIAAIMEVIPLLINSLIEAIPLLLEAAIQLLLAIVDAIPVIVTSLIEALPEIIETIVNALVEAIPVIIDGAIELFMSILEAIPVIIDSLIENLPTIIETIVKGLIEGIQAIIDGAIKLFMAILEALPVIIQALIERLPDIVITIVNVLIQNIPVLVEGAIQLFMAILKAIPVIIVELVKAIPQIIVSIVKALGNGVSKLFEAGKGLFQGVWDGLKNIWNSIVNWVTEKVNWLVDKLAFWRKGNNEMDGSHRTGLREVPFDGYIAQLHRGEMILTAAEANQYQNRNAELLSAISTQLALATANSSSSNQPMYLTLDIGGKRFGDVVVDLGDAARSARGVAKVVQI